MKVPKGVSPLVGHHIKHLVALARGRAHFAEKLILVPKLLNIGDHLLGLLRQITR